MFIFFWILICLGFKSALGYIETVVISGCESCKLHLTCRHLTSIIAILEADFAPSAANATFPTVFPPLHPRQALNQRCSGVNHCSFILAQDCPGADSWGAGSITVKFVCVSEDQILKFCNSEIALPSALGVSEGFIHNPGYPRFYSSERECHWKIRTLNKQRIRITLLDIAVFGETITSDIKNSLFFGFEAESAAPQDFCTDHLKILDAGQIVETTCKPQDPPLEVVSDSNSVEVVLASQHSLTPLRGFLLHYTAIGCPIPDAPEDGYLVYRNETSAEFRCCVGHVFSDSGERTKVINCVENRWDVEVPLPQCRRNVPFLSENSRKSLNNNMAFDSELIPPVILIVLLFTINFLVIFYIYRIRQKHAIEYAEEELGTLSLTAMSP